MKVRIVKAGKETYWYAKHIGEVYEVMDGPFKDIADKMAYTVDGEGGIVDVDDVEEVEG